MIEYENLAKLNALFKKKFEKQFQQFLETGWYILGNSVATFEKQFAAYCNTKYCVGVANGLDALILALKTLNLPPKSEILVPSNTYIATIIAILQANMKPILVEPDILTYNIDPNKIEEKISDSTKAIMVVHLYGKLCNMQAIKAIADKNNLFIISFPGFFSLVHVNDVIANFHYAVHVVCIHNSSNIVFAGNFLYQFVYNECRLRVEARVGLIAK